MVEAKGFGVVRALVGHGVGRSMHEDPQIPNYGPAGRGPKLAPGMVFAGPAIIEQDDATPLVAPGFRARVDDAHNILLERSHA